MGPLLSVAPMMAWTDRHCRYLHRLCAARATVFTEMITTGALLHGPRERLLASHPDEHPVAVQLGGSDPGEIAQAARLAEQHGYDEINLNIGCPSERVRQGRFGACLMREPKLVAELVSAAGNAVQVPVTVKCRLGVDEADSQPLLEAFVEEVAAAGCRRFYIHARKALLSGISPAQNRQIPPLQYFRVHELKASFPALTIVINGGIDSIDTALSQLQFVDGVMIGRQAYHQPGFLNSLHAALFESEQLDSWQLLDRYLPYIESEVALGTPLKDMTRHCLGLFAGLPGARRYRQLLSDTRALQSNDPDLVRTAAAAVGPRSHAAAAELAATGT